jgi:hypothetical protein
MRIVKCVLYGIQLFFFFTAKCQPKGDMVRRDTIQLHFESLVCFVDSSSGAKVVNCYFSIVNHGETDIEVPQKFARLPFSVKGAGLDIKYQIEFLSVDTLDISKQFSFNSHPLNSKDNRHIVLKPWEEYCIRVPLEKMYFPYRGNYRIRFKIDSNNLTSTISDHKFKAYSKWVYLTW